MISSLPAAFVMFTSPPGCPSRASAAGATNIGKDEGKPRRVVAGSAWDILLSLSRSKMSALKS
jgi:hypothetical protein